MIGRMCRFLINNSVSYGLLEDKDKVIVIEGNIFEKYKITGKKIDLKEVSLLPPCNATKIIGAGTNYRSVSNNGKDSLKNPIIFLKPPTSLIGAGKNIIYPEISKKVAAEVELAVVIGKVAKKVSMDTAKDYIFGYTIAVDLTAADFINGNSIWNISKMFDTFTPLGPYISNGDIDPLNLNLKLKLNEVTVQDGNTKDMIFNVYELISYTSSVMTLMPGDVILTGTPAAAIEVKRGDTLEANIEGLGSLINFVK
jgi:2-keto-4-pentenoate hydratase/2-oxohepta-3-ene-1,7-dioic acid hydratase in catechol pathway